MPMRLFHKVGEKGVVEQSKDWIIKVFEGQIAIIQIEWILDYIHTDTWGLAKTILLC